MAKSYDILGQLKDDTDKIKVDVLWKRSDSSISICECGKSMIAKVSGMVTVRCSEGYVPLSLCEVCSVSGSDIGKWAFKIVNKSTDSALVAFVQCLKFDLTDE